VEIASKFLQRQCRKAFGGQASLAGKNGAKFDYRLVLIVNLYGL